MPVGADALGGPQSRPLGKGGQALRALRQGAYSFGAKPMIFRNRWLRQLLLTGG